MKNRIYGCDLQDSFNRSYVYVKCFSQLDFVKLNRANWEDYCFR